MQEHEERDNAAYVRRVHDKGLRFDMRTMSRRRLPLKFSLVIKDLSGAAVTGAAVYAWHCAPPSGGAPPA